MQCSQVEDLLSEYVDDALDASTRHQVEQHLALCRQCSAELEEFRSYLHAMNDLDEVKAPADFLEKIHLRVEEQSTWRRIFKKLFIPLRVKLPLEFAGVLMTAVLLVIFYQQQLLHRKPVLVSGGPKTSSPPPSAMKSESRVPEKLQEEPTTQLMPAPAPRTKITEKIHLSLLLKAAPQLVEKEANDKGSLSAGIPRAKNEGLGSSSAQQQVQQKRAALREDKDHASNRDQKESASAYANLEKKQKYSADAAFLKEALSAIRDHAKEIGGEVLSVEYSAKADLLKSVTVEIPSESYPSFVTRLRQLGRFQAPPPTLPRAGSNGMIQLKIDLSPAD